MLVLILSNTLINLELDSFDVFKSARFKTPNSLALCPILYHSWWYADCLIVLLLVNLLVTIDHGLLTISAWSISAAGFAILKPFLFTISFSSKNFCNLFIFLFARSNQISDLVLWSLNPLSPGFLVPGSGPLNKSTKVVSCTGKSAV